MTDSSAHRTYQPEYADLPIRENSLMGARGRQCPGCGKLGESDAKVATRDGDAYNLWWVWYCPDCDKLWRSSSRAVFAGFRTRTKRPEAIGYEVVGDE